ncbi:MAG: 4-hydroxythreonine-4-phosphate dehydrogenase PdxA [Deltaproteobacteria bacterium]|nr:4-hydroxythreonine-4-phosphate dehydrogenase PdxA [Deltaproteobacteria bacterium]
MTKPIVAVTMGDPAGVGPEVALKALASPQVRRACVPLLLGDWDILERNRRRISDSVEFIPWKVGQSIRLHEKAVPLCSLSHLSIQESQPGRPSKASGQAACRYITKATELVMGRIADAMATAPISKKALHLAGYPYPGHTELLAELTHARECRMMLLGAKLKVVLVTGHVSLAQVVSELSRNRVLVTVELTHQALRQNFGIDRPRIAVAALNPHAGEEGIFGLEEKKIIRPAVALATRQGIRATGPCPADSLFYQAVRGDYDAVVCMYHDQGLIPLKLLHFFGGVALTLGLPIIRTSVDHGTAYEIAGTNQADASSMIEAILLAAKLARQARGNGG